METGLTGPPERSSASVDEGAVRYSLVVPAFNEAESLPALIEDLTWLMDRLDGPCEAVIVDDGSSDDTAGIVLAAERSDPRFRAIRLSRNFGHQIALTAGLVRSRGQAVVTNCAADRQHPGRRRSRDGRAVGRRVTTMRLRRHDRPAGASPPSSAPPPTVVQTACSTGSSDIPMPSNAGDFRLLDRQVVDAFVRFGERNRYIRGMVRAGPRLQPGRSALHGAGPGTRAARATPFVAWFGSRRTPCSASRPGRRAPGSTLEVLRGVRVRHPLRADHDRHATSTSQPVAGWTTIVVVGVLPRRCPAHGARGGGRVHRAHLRRGEAAAALHRARGSPRRPSGPRSTYGGRTPRASGTTPVRQGRRASRPARLAFVGYLAAGGASLALDVATLALLREDRRTACPGRDDRRSTRRGWSPTS